MNIKSDEEPKEYLKTTIVGILIISVLISIASIGLSKYAVSSLFNNNLITPSSVINAKPTIFDYLAGFVVFFISYFIYLSIAFLIFYSIGTLLSFHKIKDNNIKTLIGASTLFAFGMIALYFGAGLFFIYMAFDLVLAIMISYFAGEKLRQITKA